MNDLITKLFDQMVLIKGLQHQVKNIALNSRLIEKQQLTKEQVLEIKLIHTTLQDYFFAVAEQNPDDWSAADKRNIIETVEKIEFSLQRAWKFSENRNMHSWWYRTPHCTCPKMDNQDMMGTSHRYYAMTCPLHSGDDTKLMDRLGDLV